MSTRGLREKETKRNQAHDQILNEMLADEVNKYCAECGAKGSKSVHVAPFFKLLSL